MYGYAAEPQKVSSNSDVSKNDLYTGLAIAGVAGAVGLAYGMDQNSDEANKYWAEKRKQQRKENKAAKKQRMKEADANRKVLRQQKEDENRRNEVAKTGSSSDVDKAEQVVGKPTWRSQLDNDSSLRSTYKNLSDEERKTWASDLEADRMRRHNIDLMNQRLDEELNDPFRITGSPELEEQVNAIKNKQMRDLERNAMITHNNSVVEQNLQNLNPLNEQEKSWIASGLARSEKDLEYLRQTDPTTIEIMQKAQHHAVHNNYAKEGKYDLGSAVKKFVRHVR